MSLLSRLLELIWVRFLMLFRQYDYLQKVCKKKVQDKTGMYFSYSLLGEIELKKNNIYTGIKYQLGSLTYLKRDKLKAWISMELLGECISYKLYDLYIEIYESNHLYIKDYYLSNYYFFECFYLFVQSRYEDVLTYVETHPFLKDDRDINKLINSVKKYIAPLNESKS